MTKVRVHYSTVLARWVAYPHGPSLDPSRVHLVAPADQPQAACDEAATTFGVLASEVEVVTA